MDDNATLHVSAVGAPLNAAVDDRRTAPQSRPSDVAPLPLCGRCGRLRRRSRGACSGRCPRASPTPGPTPAFARRSGGGRVAAKTTRPRWGWPLLREAAPRAGRGEERAAGIRGRISLMHAPSSVSTSSDVKALFTKALVVSGTPQPRGPKRRAPHGGRARARLAGEKVLERRGVVAVALVVPDRRLDHRVARTRALVAATSCMWTSGRCPLDHRANARPLGRGVASYPASAEKESKWR